MSFDFDLPHAGGNLAGGAGVQPWSSPEQFVIFSHDATYGHSDELAFYLQARDIGFKALVGCYKGTKEPAWIVNARDWRQIAASGWIDGQESVLHLGPYDNGSRAAALYYGQRQEGASADTAHWIGRFHQEAKAYALKQDAWTFDPSTGDYYVAD
jgi:hypothetical protein